jgi:hypothetical protein
MSGPAFKSTNKISVIKTIIMKLFPSTLLPPQNEGSTHTLCFPLDAFKPWLRTAAACSRTLTRPLCPFYFVSKAGQQSSPNGFEISPRIDSLAPTDMTIL